jgi:chitodextrinase
MAEESSGSGLVWLVVGLMIVAGFAAYALVPAGDGPGNGGPDGPGEAPQAEFTPQNRTIVLGEVVEYSAADSTDADGRITTYEWTFGDGEHATGAIVQHEYTIVGAFEVTLTVTDEDGLHDTASSNSWVNDRVIFAPGVVNWTAGQPPSQQTVGSITAWGGATALRVSVNLSTVQPAGAKVNVSLRNPQDVEVAREARTITGTSFVVEVIIRVDQANLTAEGTWVVLLEVVPAQPVQFFVSVGYSGAATVRYDPV